MDEGLTESEETLSESRWIVENFRIGTYEEQLERYLRRLDQVMYGLHEHLSTGARHACEWDFNDLTSYWKALTRHTGYDNAHAMHLSSGNWGFNLLDPVVSELSASLGAPELNLAMTGGMLDARTDVHIEMAGLRPATDGPS